MTTNNKKWADKTVGGYLVRIEYETTTKIVGAVIFLGQWRLQRWFKNGKTFRNGMPMDVDLVEKK